MNTSIRRHAGSKKVVPSQTLVFEDVLGVLTHGTILSEVAESFLVIDLMKRVKIARMVDQRRGVDRPTGGERQLNY